MQLPHLDVYIEMEEMPPPSYFLLKRDREEEDEEEMAIKKDRSKQCGEGHGESKDPIRPFRQQELNSQ